MARTRNIERKVRLELQIDETLKNRVDAVLFSPARGRVPYSARNQLVESLLEGWLEKVESLDPIEGVLS